MSDYIKREDATQLCIRLINEHERLNERMDFVHFFEAIHIGSEFKSLPSADVVERKHGAWIQISKKVVSIPIKWSKEDDRKPIYNVKLRCSVCGFQKNFIDGYIAQCNFCPNCGADMRKE